ncbi:MAG: nucleotidyltransferase family protein [Burkholderiales bacterium]|nr:nucleotidyltransferase family protein [Burkholderiales bacterium]
MNNAAHPVVLLLAAGQGRRFGGAGHKLEQPLGDSTVLGRTLSSALASRLRLVVVCSERLAPLVRGNVAARDMVVLSEQQALEGMGSSIAAGVSAAADASGWLILPGDMPLLKPDTLRAVARSLQRDPVVFAQYRGQRGHPVGFSQELYSELIALRGDEGARRLLARYAAEPVAVDDPGVLLDVDTEDDLARAQAKHSAPGALT